MQKYYYITKKSYVDIPHFIHELSCNKKPCTDKLDALGVFFSPFQAIRQAKLKGYKNISVCLCDECQSAA